MSKKGEPNQTGTTSRLEETTTRHVAECIKPTWSASCRLIAAVPLRSTFLHLV